MDDTRLIPITLGQLWHSTRPALPRDPRHPSDATGGAWVGKREIARRFDVCARTIDHWLSRGMPHFKPSARMVRFSIPDCDVVPPTVRRPWDRQAVTRAVLPRGECLNGRNVEFKGPYHRWSLFLEAPCGYTRMGIEIGHRPELENRIILVL